MTHRLVASYRAIRLQCGYGFESCDANGLQNVQNTNPEKQRPVYGRPTFIQCWYWEELRSLYEGAEPQPSTG